MNKLIKTLLVGLIAVGLNLSVQAAEVSATTSTNATYNLLSVGALASNYRITSGADAVTVKFYDASDASSSATTAPTITNDTYTAITRYITNYTVLYTNTLGTIQTNTYSGLYNASTTVAAATNSLTPITTVVVPANTTYEPGVGTVDWNLVRGLVAIANTNATVSVTYTSK